MTLTYFDAWTQAVSPHIAPRESEAGWEAFAGEGFAVGHSEKDVRGDWQSLGAEERRTYAVVEAHVRSTDPLRVLAQALADAPTDSTRADCWAALCDYLEAMPRSHSK